MTEVHNNGCDAFVMMTTLMMTTMVKMMMNDVSDHFQPTCTVLLALYFLSSFSDTNAKVLFFVSFCFVF